MINGVNTDSLKETINKMKSDPASRKLRQTISGEWNLSESNKPQFMARLTSEKGGELVLYSDQPTKQGGSGLAPGPIPYCLFGVLSCFTSTLAMVASLKGIRLKELKASISADINMSKTFGLSTEPIIESITIDVSAKLEQEDREVVEQLIKEAEEKCPAAETLRNGTKLFVNLI